MNKWKVAGYGLGALVVLIALSFGLRAVGIMERSLFGVWERDVERQVVTESQSYVQGQVQDLVQMRREYIASGPDGKSALRAMIQREWSNFANKEAAPEDLRRWIENEIMPESY